MAAHGDNPISQTGFRGRDDNHAEAIDGGWFALLNTDWVVESLDSKFRVRFILDFGLRPQASIQAFTVWYSHNSGAFVQVTDTSSFLKVVGSDVSGYDHGDDTTQLIGDPIGHLFIGDNNSVMAESVSENFTFSSPFLPAEDELEVVLQYVPSDLKAGDTIELRVFDDNGDVLSEGYTYSPIIIIQKPQVDIKGKEFIIDGEELVIK